MNWPALVEEMLEEQRLIVTNFSQIESVLGSYVSLRDVYQKFSWNSVVIPEIEASTMNKDYEGLLKDKRFRNVIAAKRFLLYVNIEDTKRIIKDTKKIIELLKKVIWN